MLSPVVSLWARLGNFTVLFRHLFLSFSILRFIDIIPWHDYCFILLEVPYLVCCQIISHMQSNPSLEFLCFSGINIQDQSLKHLFCCFHHMHPTWLRSFGFALDTKAHWLTRLFLRYGLVFSFKVSL